MELDPKEILADAEAWLKNPQKNTSESQEEDIHLPSSLSEASSMVSTVEDEHGNLCSRFHESRRYLGYLLKQSKKAYDLCPCPAHKAMCENLAFVFLTLDDNHKAYHFLEYAVATHLENK